MGTDIHGVWQAKKNGEWVDVESEWDQGRHYLLFAWLADVKNGYGFADIPTHVPIKPIAKPRGLPKDFKRRDSKWMGDYSYSWLTADEILNADRPQTVTRIGVVAIGEYKAWDHHTPFESWCGDRSGPGIVVSTEAQIGPSTTHVRAVWSAPDGLDYFVNEVKRLKSIHGEVRLVFGFDS